MYDAAQNADALGLVLSDYNYLMGLLGLSMNVLFWGSVFAVTGRSR